MENPAKDYILVKKITEIFWESSCYYDKLCIATMMRKSKSSYLSLLSPKGLKIWEHKYVYVYIHINKQT